MSVRVRGIVKWFNNAKGFGFITQHSGEDVFVHFRSIQADGYRTLQEGQEVEFDLKDGPKGPHAEEVVKVGGEVGGESAEQSPLAAEG